MARRVRGMAVVAALLATAIRAGAAEEAIDLFSDAVVTQYVEDTNVKQGTVGSTTVADPNLSDVIGGVRGLTVTMTAEMIPGLEAVVAGVQTPLLQLFRYSASAGADGAAQLIYDRNGNGLNAVLDFAMGLRVTVAAADLTCVTPGLDVSVTLTDTFMVTVTSTQTVLLPVASGMPLALDFPFSAFAGVDPAGLFSIKIAVDPQPSALGGCDLQLAGISTYGTPREENICDDGIDNNNNGFTDCADLDCYTFPGCPHPMPALSSKAEYGALVLIVGLGLLGILRRRHVS